MEDDSTERLRQWCVEHGGVFNKGITCTRLSSAAHRGIVALKDIECNEILVSIPASLLIGKESALRDEEVVTALGSHAACLTDTQLVAIHLLRECSKGSQSFWHPYIKTLPRSYTTAASLTDEEIHQLQVPAAQRAIFRAKEEAVSSYETVHTSLSGMGCMDKRFKTLSAWIWALSTLSSRTMYMQGDTIGVLTPYGDLHNYGCPPPPFTLNIGGLNNKDPVEEHPLHGDGSFDASTNVYCVRTRSAIAQGDEVLLCYGRHTNVQLLEYYGFCLEHNPHDKAPLPIDYFCDTVQHQLCSLGVADTDVYIAYNGNPSFELMRALRLASLSSSERKSSAFKVLNDETVHRGSEKKACQLLQQALHRVLGQSTMTCIESDMQILKDDDNVSEGLRVVIQCRLGYKRILHRCLELLQACMEDSALQNERSKAAMG